MTRATEPLAGAAPQLAPDQARGRGTPKLRGPQRFAGDCRQLTFELGHRAAIPGPASDQDERAESLEA